MRYVGRLFAAFAAVAAVVLLAAGVARAQEVGQGLVSIESAYSVDETVSRLETTIAERGLTVVTQVNHAANAANVELELRPTTLLIFGNPNVGTPLMQSSQTTAIDLPQKFLVWENEAGQVQVTYNDPQYLANRHSIGGQDERLGQISTALSGLAGSVVPMPEGDDPADTPAAPEPEPTAAPDTPDTPATLPETGGSSALPWLLLAGGVLLTGGLLLVWRARRSGALLVLLAAPLLAAPLVAVPAAAQTDTGLISVESPYSVEETVSRLQNVLDENGLITVATINHAANAESVGLELRPTQLIIFGNPNIGTPLMQSSQTIGIDLPQKFLVWENEAGQVQVTYNDPQYLANRHGITDRADIISQVSTALGNLSGAATAE
jgi:LPXTG-motif cell wall-anchored protein